MVSAHNLKVVGSNPTPATKITEQYQSLRPRITRGFLLVCNSCQRHVNVWRIAQKIFNEINDRLNGGTLSSRAVCGNGFSKLIPSDRDVQENTEQSQSRKSWCAQAFRTGDGAGAGVRGLAASRPYGTERSTGPQGGDRRSAQAVCISASVERLPDIQHSNLARIFGNLIEMDNNAVERTIRPIALGRKNALFAGHDAGAANWGVIASLIETCKLNAVNPHTYLAETLTAIVNDHKQSDIDALLALNYKAAGRLGNAHEHHRNQGHA